MNKLTKSSVVKFFTNKRKIVLHKFIWYNHMVISLIYIIFGGMYGNNGKT